MTNYEKILKSKEDCEEALFALIIDYSFEEVDIDIKDWLNRKNNPTRTAFRMTALLMGSGEND